MQDEMKLDMNSPILAISSPTDLIQLQGNRNYTIVDH